MPKTKLRLFRDSDGSVPVIDWLTETRKRNRKAFAKCIHLLDLLGQFGHELRRPRADFLRDGVYELRTEVGGVNYRILYGFVGKQIALVSHGITKGKKVPNFEIDRAKVRLAIYRKDPDRYSTEEELTND